MEELYQDYQKQALRLRYRRMVLLCRLRAGDCAPGEQHAICARLDTLAGLESNLRFAMRKMKRYQKKKKGGEAAC